MEQDIKKLEILIQELMRRIERHEWQIADLEKRIKSQGFMDNEGKDQQQAEYKEPIFQKASAFTPKLKKSTNKKVTTFKVVTGVLLFIGATLIVVHFK